MARFAQALLETPEAVGDHRQARRAAPADDVAEAAGECAELATQRWRFPAPGVVAAAGAPARVSGASERAQARVGRRAAMVKRRRGEVQDRRVAIARGDRSRETLAFGRIRRTLAFGSHPPFGQQPFLPLLLVAVQPRASRRRARRCSIAARRTVMLAPQAKRTLVGVAWPEVERGDRRALAPAGVPAPTAAALKAGADGAGEDLCAGVLAGAPQQRLQPSGANLDVVVDEHHQLAVRVGDAGVAGGVEAEAAACAKGGWRRSAGECAHLGRGPAVLDHQQLGPGGGGLGGDRGERDLEVVGARTGGDDDRGGGIGRGQDAIVLDANTRSESIRIATIVWVQWSSSCTTATARREVRSVWWTT